MTMLARNRSNVLDAVALLVLPNSAENEKVLDDNAFEFLMTLTKEEGKSPSQPWKSAYGIEDIDKIDGDYLESIHRSSDLVYNTLVFSEKGDSTIYQVPPTMLIP